MSSLRAVEANLPPGFRFHPKDEELICDYLMNWMMGCPAHPLLVEVDLNKCEPWDIPETACVGGKEWYFYSQRDRKYATGLRTNRATVSGYWKATGKDRPVIRKRNLVGMRKTLVFYQGRAPKGRKTDWVMHEYRLEGPSPKAPCQVKEDWVLCRMFFKDTSHVPSKFKELENEVTPSSPPLPALMEPYNNSDLFNEHVSCFSIFSTNQAGPTFPLLDHVGPPDIITVANSGGSHLRNYENSPSLPINNGPCSSSCDEEVINAVLSEVGLCSIWNQY